jgi:hypothetical protein
MDCLDTLYQIFHYLDKPQHYKSVCKIWGDVIDQNLKLGNYIESEWIKTHRLFQKLKNDERFVRGKPKGMLVIEKINLQLGITFQIFCFSETKSHSLNTELVFSDYLGTKLKLRFPPIDLYVVGFNATYNMDKIDETNNLFISFEGHHDKKNFKFDFELFSLTESNETFFLNTHKYLGQSRLIEFNSEEELISYEITKSSFLNLRKSSQNQYLVSISFGNDDQFFPIHTPSMIQKMNDQYLFLFYDYCLLFKTKTLEITKIDLSPLISNISHFQGFFIFPCHQRQTFVLGSTRRTNKSSNLKKLYLHKIL